jgi:hypothetical protein
MADANTATPPPAGQEPPKRGRGRPRKHPIKTDADKRPPGRPRIHPVKEQPPGPADLLLVDEAELAKRLDISRGFLRGDRLGKRIIPFVRIGVAVRYDLAEVSKVIQGLKRGGVAL